MSSLRISEERGVRYMHFGSRWVQGAMRMSRPFALELEYTRYMLFPLLLRSDPSWPRRVLLIGLGAGSLTKFLYRERPRASLDVVEIREDVMHAAREFFRVPDDAARVSIKIADGAHFVAGRDEHYDLILIDGYDARGRVGSLDTPLFHRHCRARLRRDGIVTTNLLSRHRGVDESLERMRAAHDGRAFALPPCASGNIVVVGVAGAAIELDGSVLAPRARALREASGLDLGPLVKKLDRAKAGAPSVI
ncbi:MAG TPA: spermidine synthase [Casimicrobiaceae bacterium]|nr:spermidine synthase [Casimicrobiaceae bacterium]